MQNVVLVSQFERFLYFCHLFAPLQLHFTKLHHFKLDIFKLTIVMSWRLIKQVELYTEFSMQSKTDMVPK